jgi:alpha-tubulin suppressor-like RCC1 family protein
LKYFKKTVLASAIAVTLLMGSSISHAYTDWSGTHCDWICTEAEMTNLSSKSPDYLSSLGNKSAPKYGNKMTGGLQIEKVTFGYLGGMALDFTGHVYTWGYNNFGRLGIGKNEDYAITKGTSAENIPANRWAAGQMYGGGLTPVDFFVNPEKYGSTELTGKTKIVDIGSGYQNHVAVDEMGRVWVWGSNYGHVAGVPESNFKEFKYFYTFPRLLKGLPADKKIVKVWGSSADLGHYQDLALTEDGQLWTWGSNDFGKHGTGDTTLTPEYESTPHRAVFPDGTVITDARGGFHSNMALDDKGHI